MGMKLAREVRAERKAAACSTVEPLEGGLIDPGEVKAMEVEFYAWP